MVTCIVRLITTANVMFTCQRSLQKHTHTLPHVQYSIECTHCNSVVTTRARLWVSFMYAFHAVFRASHSPTPPRLQPSYSVSSPHLQFHVGFHFNSQSIGCYKTDYVPPSVRFALGHKCPPTTSALVVAICWVRWPIQLVIARHSLSIDDSLNYGHYNDKYIFMVYYYYRHHYHYM